MTGKTMKKAGLYGWASTAFTSGNKSRSADKTKKPPSTPSFSSVSSQSSSNETKKKKKSKKKKSSSRFLRRSGGNNNSIKEDRTQSHQRKLAIDEFIDDEGTEVTADGTIISSVPSLIGASREQQQQQQEQPQSIAVGILGEDDQCSLITTPCSSFDNTSSISSSSAAQLREVVSFVANEHSFADTDAQSNTHKLNQPPGGRFASMTTDRHGRLRKRTLSTPTILSPPHSPSSTEDAGTPKALKGRMSADDILDQMSFRKGSSCQDMKRKLQQLREAPSARSLFTEPNTTNSALASSSTRSKSFRTDKAKKIFETNPKVRRGLPTIPDYERYVSDALTNFSEDLKLSKKHLSYEQAKKVPLL